MRWKMIVAYDGTDHFGWQSQQGGRAVQDVIEEKLKRVFKQPVRMHGASRTDSGVHAKGQVAHFDAEWTHGADKLKRAIESGLPDAVQIVKLQKVSDKFHARFGAKGKRYRYTIILGPANPFEVRWAWSFHWAIDKKKLKRALNDFVGVHNFTAIAANVEEKENPIKTITKCDVVWKTKKKAVIEVVGSGFMYKMVRSMVGAAVAVARGKLAPEKIKEMLKTKKRTHEVVTAPPQGLCLEKVFYGKK